MIAQATDPMAVLPTLTRQQRIRRRMEPLWQPESATSITHYEQCPSYYKRIDIDRSPEAPNRAGEFGKAIHLAIKADLLGEPRPAYNGPLEYAIEWSDILARFNDEVKPQLAGEAVFEQELFGEIKDGEQTVQIRGFLDRLKVQGTHAEVDDWKSGRKVALQSELAQNIQACIYDWIVKENMSWLETVTFRLWPLRFNDRPRTFTFNRAHTEVFEELLRGKTRSMREDQVFKPNPGCGICPPGSHITVDAGAVSFANGVTVEIHEPTTQVEADQLATALRAIQQLEKALVEPLKVWTKREGRPAAVATANGAGGGYYDDFGRNERECIDMESAITILKGQFGEAWSDYLRLDLTALKPYLDSKKKALPELQALMRVKRSSFFTWRATAPAARLTEAPPPLSAPQPESAA